MAASLLVQPMIALAQDEPDNDQIHPLALKEEMVRDRFTRFEDRIYRLREQLEDSEPENATRLRRVLQRAGELGLAERLDTLIPLFRDPSKLDSALDSQSGWLADADRLLAILTERDSGDEERKAEIDRLQNYHEKLGKILEKERALRNETGQSGMMQRLGKQLDQAIRRTNAMLQKQGKLSEQSQDQSSSGKKPSSDQKKAQTSLSRDAEQLAKDLKRLAEQASKMSEESPATAEAKESIDKAAQSAGESAQSMSQAGEQMKSGNAGKAQQQQEDAKEALERTKEQLEKAKEQIERQSQSQQLAQQQKQVAGETGALSQQMQQESSNSPQQKGGQQQGGQQQKGGQQKSGKQQSSPSQAPGQQSLDKAQQEMNDASQSLDEQTPSKATESQDRAIEELEQAQKELEEALAQLREEEKEETLRDLEARFRELLTKQRGINGNTTQLAQIGEENFKRAEHLALAELASKQKNLSEDAATCLHILDEDGTTIVFPRVVEQISQDMRLVAGRIAERKVGALTQSVQEEIVDALEQLLEAVKKMQQDAEQGKQMAGGDPGESPLLPESAELKLLRASQVRINTRTGAIQTEASQKGADELLERALQTVATRQNETAEIAKEMRDRARMP